MAGPWSRTGSGRGAKPLPLGLKTANDRIVKLVQLDPAVVAGGQRIEDARAQHWFGAV